MKKILLFIFLLPTLAFAQLELPFPIKLVNPKPVDFWYFESDGTPYDNTGEVTTQVLSAIRYIGQTFNVNGVEYWFKDGITDGDLIAKGGMVYPGAGIPISTGSAWGTSITDNSANWNAAAARTFSNGLTETGGAVKVGGSLIENTTISGLNNTLNINLESEDGESPFTVDIEDQAAGNHLRYTFGAYGFILRDVLSSINLALISSDALKFNPSTGTSTLEIQSTGNVASLISSSTRLMRLGDNGVELDLGSDAEEDIYVRRGTYLTRIPLGSSGDVLTNVSGTVGWAAPSGGGGGGLTVGTSTITSGTNTKILYDNSGVLGEYTVSGSGNVAMTTSPTFTTPALGTPSALVGTNITGTATGLTSGITNALKSATTTVDVSSATAPTTGQVLTATSGTAATWQTPASASGAWLLASGGTATGTNTFAMGSNPFILTSGVTTGTGATAGIQNVFNSLTTGNGLDISTSSLTTGKGLALTSTSTAINHTIGTNALFSSRISGTNANSSRTAVAGEFKATNTGTTSSNIAIYAAASGGTTNYSFYASGQMYVEGLTTSSYVAYFKAGGLNQGIYISSNGGGILPIQSSWTDLGNSSQRFKNAFFSGNVSTGGITTVLATLHSRGTGTTTGYNLLTENSGATARFGVRDNGAIEFSGSAGTSGQIPVSAGASSPPVWTDQTIQTVKITVSSAEILALNTTPKTLVAAPGAGKIIDVISVETYLDYNSAAYTTNTTAWVSYNTSGGNLHVTGLNLAAGAFDYHRKISLDAQVDYNTSVRVNTPLVLYADSGDPLAGNSTYYVYVTYRIITL